MTATSSTTRPSALFIPPKAVLFLGLWYFFSACTLFLNKVVVDRMHGDAYFLACSQMWMTSLLGLLQLRFPLGMYDLKTAMKNAERREKKKLVRNLCIVGNLRFATVILGLVALEYVEVSFTETVKSSAPAVTVVVSWLLLDESTGRYVLMSLLPVMGGLALCSANELSFNILGFLAAMGTNVSECLQNVYSKMLISGDAYKLSPAEVQYHTSIWSLLIQLPTLLLCLDYERFLANVNVSYLLCCALNGVFFHFQTITAYVLMDFISPVTHSVANTVKRALLIWLSVVLFHNEVTLLSAMGTAVVFVGVLCYNRAKAFDNYDKAVAHHMLKKGDDGSDSSHKGEEVRVVVQGNRVTIEDSAIIPTHDVPKASGVRNV